MSDDPLHQLGHKINQLRGSHDAQGRSPLPSSKAIAMRAGTDLVSGVAVGVGVGYALDAWLDTLPWFLLICTCFGLVAGLKLMIETATKATHALEEEEKRNNAQEPQ